MKAELVMLGAATLKAGSPLWQGSVPIGNDNDDVQSYGECPVYQALGVTSLAYPKDANGHAEGVLLTQVGNKKAIYIGGRDTRNAKVVGKGDPGDTILHSTGPNQAAQFRAQEKKRMGSIVVQDKDGKHQVFALDGENKKAQLFVNGAAIEIDDSGDITLAGAGGASILIQGNEIVLNGVLRLPGMPPGTFLVAANSAAIAALAGLAGGTVLACNGVGGTS